MTDSLTDSALLKDKVYIDGKWCQSDSGECFEVVNPADDSLLAKVPYCGAGETSRAIDAAQQAGRSWRAQPVKIRARLLRRWGELIVEHQDDLARILTLEQGKPLAEARGEILYGASYAEWFAEQCKRIDGDMIPAPAEDKRIMCIKQPVGVVACITPWNFPNAMLTRKIAPALAAGCTVVCKPAESTPLSALALAELAERAGIPKGVINMVVGDVAAIGQTLTQSPVVAKLTFTGSTRVGKLLIEQCASTVKRTSMELGGNAPFIVFSDADIDEAVKGAMICKFRNAGQTCVCANRILVHDDVFDLFLEQFVAAVAKLKLGEGISGKNDVGPLINDAAVDKVNRLMRDAMDKGAKIAVGGFPHSGCRFYPPTVLVDVDEQMDLFHQEIFGPVAAVYRFSDDEQALKMANDSEYGLASYFYTRDLSRVFRFSEQLEYGMVGINEGIVSNEMAPFGGVKHSGNGREGSKYGIDDYLEIKYICLGGI